MAQQNYKNHRQIVPTFHILTGLSLGALVFGSVNNLILAADENRYDASLMLLATLVLLSIYIHSRMFALKAQDRAIRAEEGLRHLLLTGKPINQRLTIGQVIALRFASDEEFPILAEKAAAENLSNKEIKMHIQAWRPDTHRV